MPTCIQRVWLKPSQPWVKKVNLVRSLWKKCQNSQRKVSAPQRLKPELRWKGSRDVHLIVMHKPLPPNTEELLHCLLIDFPFWNSILHHNLGCLPTLQTSCLFYSCLFPFSCVCMITRMWSLCMNVRSECSFIFLHIIHWARVSQSNSELGRMAVLPSQLALGIPCILFPELELQTVTTPSWHIVWVLGIWTLLLTWL